MSNTDKEEIQRAIEYIRTSFKNTPIPETFYIDAEMTPANIKALEQYFELLDYRNEDND